MRFISKKIEVLLCLFFFFVMVSCAPHVKVTEENAEELDPTNINLHKSNKSLEQEFAILSDYLKKRSNKSLCLNPPASDEQIALLQNQIGKKLPEDVVKLYKISNGQRKDSDCVYFLHEGTALLSLDDMFSEWSHMKTIYEKHASFGELFGKSGAVYEYGWTLDWVPIASFINGDYVCIDFNPTPLGKSGQIIDFFHEGGRIHLGLSITDYLATLNEQIKSGKLAFDASCNCLSQVGSDSAWKPNQ